MIEILKSKTANGAGGFSIFKAGSSTYIVPSWIKVPAGTKMEDVRVIDDGPVKIVKKTYSKHKVKGSTGKTYEVVIDSTNGDSCSCTGFGFRRYCKHIEQVKNGK